MKKIFTLAAAVLASFSLWAADVTMDLQLAKGSTPTPSVGAALLNGGAFDGTGYKMGSDGNFVGWNVAATEMAITAVSFNGYINTNNTEKNWGIQFSTNGGETWEAELSQANDGTKSYHNIAVTVDIPEGANAIRIIRRAGTSSFVASITLTLEASAPVIDPVTSVSIDGPEAIYVGQKASYTATTDVKANDYKWFVNEAEQEGANAAKFDFTPEAAGTYAIACLAKNDNNADWVASEEINLVASVKPVLEQVSISESTTWDWNNAASVNEIKLTDETSPAKNERCLLANLEGMNNDANFNSQALIFEGEYAMRIQSNMKMAQGQLLGFNTTVAGYLTVEYSNTGNRTAAEGETEGQESERRFITVNGNLIGSDAGSMKSNETVTVNNIPVAAGDVLISALRPYYTDHTTEPQYVRFYKVQFTKSEGDVPSAINNTEAEVQAVKFFENGQLIIMKNGVLYNAQGSVVK